MSVGRSALTICISVMAVNHSEDSSCTTAQNILSSKLSLPPTMSNARQQSVVWTSFAQVGDLEQSFIICQHYWSAYSLGSLTTQYSQMSAWRQNHSLTSHTLWKLLSSLKSFIFDGVPLCAPSWVVLSTFNQFESGTAVLSTCQVFQFLKIKHNRVTFWDSSLPDMEPECNKNKPLISCKKTLHSRKLQFWRILQLVLRECFQSS